MPSCFERDERRGQYRERGGTQPDDGAENARPERNIDEGLSLSLERDRARAAVFDKLLDLFDDLFRLLLHLLFIHFGHPFKKDLIPASGTGMIIAESGCKSNRLERTGAKCLMCKR